MTLLAEFGMTEHDFVRTQRERQIADRRFADLLAVDPHLCPGHGVQGDVALGELDLDRSDLACRHLYGASRPIADKIVDDLDVVLAGRYHQPIALARAN